MKTNSLKKRINRPPRGWVVTGFFIHPNDTETNTITTIFSPQDDLFRSEWIRNYKGNASIFPIAHIKRPESPSSTKAEDSIAERLRRSTSPSPPTDFDKEDVDKVRIPSTPSSTSSKISILREMLSRAADLSFRASRYNRADSLSYISSEISRFLSFAQRSYKYILNLRAFAHRHPSERRRIEGDVEDSCDIVLSEILPAIVIFEEFLDMMEDAMVFKETCMERLWAKTPTVALRKMNANPTMEEMAYLEVWNCELAKALSNIPG